MIILFTQTKILFVRKYLFDHLLLGFEHYFVVSKELQSKI